MSVDAFGGPLTLAEMAYDLTKSTESEEEQPLEVSLNTNDDSVYRFNSMGEEASGRVKNHFTFPTEARINWPTDE